MKNDTFNSAKTVNKFIENGFTKYDENGFTKCEWNDDFKKLLLQKRISNADGTKYFINVYLWQFPDHESFKAQITFYRENDTFHLNFITQEPEHSERLAEEFWAKMGMELDQHNN